MLFSPSTNSDHVIVSISFEFLSSLNGDAPFYHTSFDFFCIHGDGLQDHLKDVLWKSILNLGTFSAASRFFG